MRTLDILVQLATVQLSLTSLKILNVTTWIDSTVILSWIKSPTAKFKTFVANLVGKIQELTNPTRWRHVPSEMNPADCTSRGLTPIALVNHKLW